MAQVKKILVHESKPAAASNVATYNVPSFDTIDSMYLEFTASGSPSTTANIISSVGKIAVSINGEQVINTTAERLFDFYKSLGNEVNNTTTKPANIIELNAGRLMFLDPENEDYFAWGCQNINTIQVQVYYNGTVTGVTDCNLVTERRPIQSSLGSYVKLISYPQSFTGTGTSVVDSLPRDSNEAYLSILASSGSGTISGGECVVNGVNIYDHITPQMNDMVVSSRNFSPVSGYFNYLFSDRSKRGMLPMPGVTELRLKTTFSVSPGVYDLLAATIKNIPAPMLSAFNQSQK